MVMIDGTVPNSCMSFDPRVLVRILLDKLQAPVGEPRQAVVLDQVSLSR